ncbi:FbpB family small basic protein [Sporolactobacillus laevolacticus]|nr:FbpB family small basic protein [Sporolactobacillus laevolacticus]
MKRKVTYLQLVKKNQEEIWKNSNELNRIETIIDERRISGMKKSIKK